MARSRPVQANSRRTCDTCNGKGTVPVDPRDRRKGDRTCTNCNGNGKC